MSQAQESAIWKSVMLELYGTEWSVQLASMDDGPAAADDAAADLGGAPAAAQERVAAGSPPGRPLSPGSGLDGAMTAQLHLL